MLYRLALLFPLFVIRPYYCHLVYDPQFFDERNNDWNNQMNSAEKSSTEGYIQTFTDGPVFNEHTPFNVHHNHPEPKYTFRGRDITGIVKTISKSVDYMRHCFTDFFKPKEYNPMFRGGLDKDPDNTFISSTTEQEDTRRSTESNINKAKYWCKKYQSTCKEKEEETSDLKPRIIGGRPAPPREHTHMVSVGYGSAEDKHWLCGGSLISSRYVLSAAHCTSTVRWGKARWARLGDLDLASPTDDANPQEKIILQHFNHPEYKEPAVYNDIALFKLDSDVTMTNWVSPICLQTSTEIEISKVVVTGWGRTGFVSDTSSVLMEVEIGLYNDTECRKVMEQIEGSKLPRGIDSKTMMCAGVKQGGKDACTGDSGGPLITETSKCTRVQVGITSIGRDCGLPNTPGIYTRISYYIPWIESIVWK